MGKGKRKKDLSQNEELLEYWINRIENKIPKFDPKSPGLYKNARPLQGEIDMGLKFPRDKWPWEKIKDCLKELDIDDETIELLVFTLKPYRIEEILMPKPDNNSREDIDWDYESELKRTLRQLPALLSRLESLSRDWKYKDFPPLFLTMERLRVLNFSEAWTKGAVF